MNGIFPIGTAGVLRVGMFTVRFVWTGCSRRGRWPSVRACFFAIVLLNRRITAVVGHASREWDKPVYTRAARHGSHQGCAGVTKGRTSHRRLRGPGSLPRVCAAAWPSTRSGRCRRRHNPPASARRHAAGLGGRRAPRLGRDPANGGPGGSSSLLARCMSPQLDHQDIRLVQGAQSRNDAGVGSPRPAAPCRTVSEAFPTAPRGHVKFSEVSSGYNPHQETLQHHRHRGAGRRNRRHRRAHRSRQEHR